jgi:hypothetical protein
MSSEAPAPSFHPQTAFISGPVRPEDGYFSTHYAPRILAAIEAGHLFVTGPAPGVDSIALDFLLANGVSPDRITIYMTYSESKWNEYGRKAKDSGVGIKVTGVTTTERDAQMTADSDYDILRYRTEEECQKLYGKCNIPGHVSATEKNERRRKQLAGQASEAVEGSMSKEADGVEEKLSWWERKVNVAKLRKVLLKDG